MWHVINNIDEQSAKKDFFFRSPFLEMGCLSNMDLDMVTVAENMPRDKPRLLKTHLPFELLPPQLLDTAKVIYVCRNPKDTCVSWYHHIMIPMEDAKDYVGYIGTFEQLAKMFIDGRTVFGDYWHMLRSGWERRFHPNLKFLWYEDMRQDLVPVIKDLCNFTGYELSAEKVEQLYNMMNIDKFRNRMVEGSRDEAGKEAMKNFVRKGIVGDWKNHFGNDLNIKFDDWIQKNLLETPIPVPHVQGATGQ